MPNAAFFRSQADAYCRLAEVIETGDVVTASGLILAEELRGLASEYYAQAERLLIDGEKPGGAGPAAEQKSADPGGRRSSAIDR